MYEIGIKVTDCVWQPLGEANCRFNNFCCLASIHFGTNGA